MVALVSGISCGASDSLTLPSDALPSFIEALRGDAQTGVVGQPLRDSLVVRLTDTRDRPVLGQKVEFRAIAGGDSSRLQPDTAITDGDGRARSRWSLGTTAGPQTVVARVISPAARPGLSITFTASAVPGPPDTIVAVRGQDQVAPAGQTLADSLIAEVTDRFGNRTEGIAVTWSVPPGEGSVSAMSTVTGSDGRTGVLRTLGSSPGAETTVAQVLSTPNVSVVFRHTALAAEPTTTTITGQAPNPSDSGQSYRVTFAVTSSGAGTPTGNVTVSEGVQSCTADVATGFCDLTSTVVGTRTLTASYSGDANFAASVSAGVTHTVNPIGSAPVYHLVFTVQPADTRAGDKIQPPVKVTVLDQNNNVFVTDTVQIHLTLGNNPLNLATLGGTTTRHTQSGVASFNDLKVTGVTVLTDFTLIASASGMPDVTSAPFAVSP